MRRTKSATSLFEPQIYDIMEAHAGKGNVSNFLHDLACAALIKAGVLTGQMLRDMYAEDDSVSDMPMVQDKVS